MWYDLWIMTWLKRKSCLPVFIKCLLIEKWRGLNLPDCAALPGDIVTFLLWKVRQERFAERWTNRMLRLEGYEEPQQRNMCLLSFIHIHNATIWQVCQKSWCFLSFMHLRSFPRKNNRIESSKKKRGRQTGQIRTSAPTLWSDVGDKWLSNTQNVSGYVCNHGSPSGERDTASPRGRYGERLQRDSCLKIHM